MSARSRKPLWAAGAGLALCCTLILAITLWPHPVDRGHERTVELLIALAHRAGAPAGFGYAHLEALANVALFVPPGLLLGWLLPARRLWFGVLLLPLLSAGVETAQLLFLEQRYATVDDVVANSLGGWAGLALAALSRWALSRWAASARRAGRGK